LELWDEGTAGGWPNSPAQLGPCGVRRLETVLPSFDGYCTGEFTPHLTKPPFCEGHHISHSREMHVWPCWGSDGHRKCVRVVRARGHGAAEQASEPRQRETLLELALLWGHRRATVSRRSTGDAVYPNIELIEAENGLPPRARNPDLLCEQFLKDICGLEV
jgi:hypothetical protein